MGSDGEEEVSEVRKQKVDQIFRRFDVNGDGRLNRDEMAALVIAVNPRVKFSEDQIRAILDEVFRTYGPYIEGVKGLSLDGLLRTYDDGAGDVDRDFDALGLVVAGPSSEEEVIPRLVSITDEWAPRDMPREMPRETPGETPREAPKKVEEEVPRPSELEEEVPKIASITDEAPKFVPRKGIVGAWASSPTNGIVYNETWILVEEVELYLRKVDKKIEEKKRRSEDVSLNNAGVEDDEELGSVSKRENQANLPGRKVRDIGGQDSVRFRSAFEDFKSRADEFRTRGELQAFDAHMAVGLTYSDHRWYNEASTFFRRAIDIRPLDPRAHFRSGNTLYRCGKLSDARAAYVKAVEELDKSRANNSLLPQVLVNLGILLEEEGMLYGASEQYRKAAIQNPRHYRALKQLGSALLGVGEYHDAQKALEAAIDVKYDYVDAHCDLGLTLVGKGESELAIKEFQKAIDLKPDHVDALYNLGGLLLESGKYSRAAEMYSNVLAIRPGDWRAELNRAVALLGVGDHEAAEKGFKDAYKTCNRVEVYDAIRHVKQLAKKPNGTSSLVQNAAEGLLRDANGGAGPCPDGYISIEVDRFHRATRKTSPRLWFACALGIRRFQKETRLYKFKSDALKVELDNNAEKSGSVGRAACLIRKADLEIIMRRLLPFLSPESFQASMKAINEKLFSVFDRSSTGSVDLRMFLASITPLCATLTLEKRQYLVFRLLAWRHRIEGQIPKADAKTYIKYLREMYLPADVTRDMKDLDEEDDNSDISYSEFLSMFNNFDLGNGVFTILTKLELVDSILHRGDNCAVCYASPIRGPLFREVEAKFNLCSSCYSEGKVPSTSKQAEYFFKENASNTLEAMREKFNFLRLKAAEDSEAIA